MTKHVYRFLIIALVISTIPIYPNPIGILWIHFIDHGPECAKVEQACSLHDYGVAVVCMVLVVIGNLVRQSARRTSR